MAPAISWWTRLTPKSLRIRLALLAALLLSLIQFILGIVFYGMTSNWLLNQVDQSLLTTAAQVASTFHENDPLEGDNLNFQFNDGDEATDTFLRERQFFIRVIDKRTGAILDESANYDVAVTQQALTSSNRFETLTMTSEHDSLARIYTLTVNDEESLVLQIGQSLDEVTRTQAEMGRLLGLMLLATALLALGTGWFLAARALIPVNAITQTAQNIGEQDLHRRISINLPDDELGRLAQTFNRMLDRIEEAFRRQQQFTADAAHELRTPLAIMQTGVEVIPGQERSPAQYRATLATIQEEVQRLTTLTINLLMLARADARTFTLERHSMDLSLLLHTVADQMMLTAEQKQIRIQRYIAPNNKINADEDRLIQVALNLLENAVKYTPNGGTITITLTHLPYQVCFSIADTGRGIPPEHLPHIFDRFYRADRARTRHKGSVGLGLAIAQQIVQLHGGEITVSSQVGTGTRFSVILPTSSWSNRDVILDSYPKGSPGA